MKYIFNSLAALWLLSLDASASKYDDALELYKEGPEKAPQIIKLLKEHLAGEPKDDRAFKLLGLTQFGTGKNEEALATFEKAIDLLAEDDRISAQILMLKARTLYALDRKLECKKILEVYWAFWQDDEELEKSYQWYWDRVKTVAPPTSKPGEQDAPSNGG